MGLTVSACCGATPSMRQAVMRLRGLLALSILIIVSGQASATGADKVEAPRPFFADADLNIAIQTRDDRRTLVATRGTGVYAGVFDPLFNADRGRAGKIVAIRLATPSEMADFPHREADHFYVFTYSTGDLLVVDVRGDGAIRPTRCGGNGLASARRNLACKLDLRKAKLRFIDALNTEFLSDGPSMRDYKAFDFPVPCSDIVIHVDADGRTVSATNGSGRRLWRADPFKRAHLKPYRFFRPTISRLGSSPQPGSSACQAGESATVFLSYNSTQSGTLDPHTGRFDFGGQD
ncbi:MAG: hypothetical protein WC729_19800 [Sphingomonas sp.]